jgi:hypothetical protein
MQVRREMQQWWLHPDVPQCALMRVAVFLSQLVSYATLLEQEPKKFPILASPVLSL